MCFFLNSQFLEGAAIVFTRSGHQKKKEGYTTAPTQWAV